MTRSSFIPLILAVVAIIVSLMLGRYGAYLAHVVAIAAIGAMSLNLLNGWCGQINFAQAALLGVGAYTAGNFGNAGWDVFSLLAAGIASALAAVLIGLPALRLRGLYFAIATLAAQFIFEYLFKFAEPITHGVSGLLIQPMRLFGRVIDTDQSYAVLAICLLLLTWFFMTWIRRTDLGRAFLVVRENEVVARGMGINVPQTKMWAFLISGFFAGIAGGLMGFTDRLAPSGSVRHGAFGRLYRDDHRGRARVAYGLAAGRGVCQPAPGSDPALWRGVWHSQPIVSPSRDGVRPSHYSFPDFRAARFVGDFRKG